MTTAQIVALCVDLMFAIATVNIVQMVVAFIVGIFTEEASSAIIIAQIILWVGLLFAVLYLGNQMQASSY